jgi:hypothetical protein
VDAPHAEHVVRVELDIVGQAAVGLGDRFGLPVRMRPVRVQLAVERSVRIGAEADQGRDAVLVRLVGVHDGDPCAARGDQHLADAPQPLSTDEVEPSLEERAEVRRGGRLALGAVTKVRLLVHEQGRVLRGVDDDRGHPGSVARNGLHVERPEPGTRFPLDASCEVCNVDVCVEDRDAAARVRQRGQVDDQFLPVGVVFGIEPAAEDDAPRPALCLRGAVQERVRARWHETNVIGCLTRR